MTEKRTVLNPTAADIEKLEKDQMAAATKIKTIEPTKEIVDEKIVDIISHEFKDDDIFSPKKVTHKLVAGKHNYPELNFITSKGEISIRRMTATEEGYFYEALEKGLNMTLFFATINRMIDSCVRTNIDTYKLSLIEKTPLFLHILALTYDNKHTFTFKCDECESEYEIKLDLVKDFVSKIMPKSFKLPVKIPLKGYDFPLTLYLNYPLIQDEAIYLSTETNWLGKIRTIIEKIEGVLPDGTVVDESHYDSIINNLDKVDTKKVKDTLNDIVTNYGLNLSDITIKSMCKNKSCTLWNKDQVKALPLDEILLNVFTKDED